MLKPDGSGRKRSIILASGTMLRFGGQVDCQSECLPGPMSLTARCWRFCKMMISHKVMRSLRTARIVQERGSGISERGDISPGSITGGSVVNPCVPTKRS